VGEGDGLVQGWLVAVISGDPGAGGDVLMVAFACGQVNARGGRVVAVCGARRVGMRTGDEGRGCG
jgi:predicted ATP-dependent serine protease